MHEIKRRNLNLIPLADKKMVEEYTRLSQSTLRNWRINDNGEEKNREELYFFLDMHSVILFRPKWATGHPIINFP